MYERLMLSLALASVLTVVCSFAVGATDSTTQSGTGSILHKYCQSDEVGDFYHTDPNFSPTMRNLRHQAVTVRSSWRGWYAFQSMGLIREIMKHSPENFKQRDLACRFKFSVTDKNKVQDVKILEPSADPEFDHVVELGIKSLEKSKLKFPSGTKERSVLVEGTYTSKPAMNLDVTTKNGISLVKREFP